MNIAIVEQSPCFLLFPFLFLSCPLSFPFTYLEPSLLWKDPVHLGPRLLVNCSPHFHPLPHICTPHSKIPTPLGFPELNMHITKTTSRTWLTRSSTVLAWSVYHFLCFCRVAPINQVLLTEKNVLKLQKLIMETSEALINCARVQVIPDNCVETIWLFPYL